MTMRWLTSCLLVALPAAAAPSPSSDLPFGEVSASVSFNPAVEFQLHLGGVSRTPSAAGDMAAFAFENGADAFARHNLVNAVKVMARIDTDFFSPILDAENKVAVDERAFDADAA